MPSIRDIRKRIRAVQNTCQITKAMEMVAAARLRKAQQQIESYRPYALKMREMLTHLSGASGAVDHPYFATREIRKAVLVVITSDRGLCGSYNSNIIRRANLWMAENADKNPALILIGKKAVDFYKFRKMEVSKKYVGFGGKFDMGRIRQLTRELSDLFLSGQVDQITLLYTAFLSVASCKATILQFLPIKSEFKAEEHAKAREYIFEPNAAEIYKQLLPNYAQVLIQMALAESLASEHGTRMLAMGAATRNAREMIDHLTMVRNKVRQAAITKELLEIVSGAEALNK